MRRALSDEQARLLRLHAQKLSPQASLDDATSVVQAIVAVQAQEPAAADLSVCARSNGLTVLDIQRARVEERSLVRTWGLRGTLHLLTAEDLGWLLPLVGPVFIAENARRRLSLGLDEEVCMRGMALLREVLASQGPLTRDQLVEQLARRDLHLSGQARPHLLMRAALAGLICFGPDQGTEPTYVLLDDWLKSHWRATAQPEVEAHTALTLRYLSAYGPATPEDQAAWSGLSLRATRAAWQLVADQLLEVEVSGSPAWLLKRDAHRLDEASSSTPIVRLLPRYDTYWLGYRNRDLIVPSQYAKCINAGGGIVHPAILVDGIAVGTWSSLRRKERIHIAIEPFQPLPSDWQPTLQAEVDKLSAFLMQY